MSEQLGPDLSLLEKLAAGGMAEVFLARQHGYGGFEKKVAVKRILQNFAKNEDFKKMFQAEANLSAQLQHPNIAQIFGNGEVEGYLYLVMEFVDGRNARQLLARADKRKVKIPIDISCFLISEVAKGLEYAHNFTDEKTGEHLEIVHRDMSPQNIMLSYDGAVKVVDFGIAKAASRSEGTRAGVLKGKFGYMSPEQASGMKLDRRTDIFALGIILFELITQRRLFASDDDLKTLNLVKECRVPRPSKYNPSVNPGLDRIVMKALAKEKGERYQSAGELYEDLVRLMTQRYPKFISTDFTKFFKELFAEDILDEKKRREKLMSEATPAFLEKAAKSNRPAMPSPGKNDDPRLFEVTQVSQNPVANETVVSDSGAEGLESPPQSLEVSMVVDSALRVPESQHLELPLPSSQSDQLTSYHVDAKVSDVPTQVDPVFAAQSNSSSRRPLLYAVLVIGLGLIAWGTLNKNHSTVAKKNVPEVVEDPMAAVVETEKKQKESENNEIVSASSPPANQELPSAPPPSAVPVLTPPATPVAEIPETPEEIRQPASNNAVGRSAKTLPGYLNLDAVPRATEILINGRVLRNEQGETLTTPIKRFALPPGVHTIQLRSKAFDANWSGDVRIESDRIVDKEAVLK